MAIDLSIYVQTYNHEKYIARALDSILMQKTSYNFEVLVGEDCSTDGTRDILKQYEKDHPGFFQMFYREENMHNKPITNGADLKSRCKGKYIIALEGDDYWTDENKIQKQIEFLETHSEYIAVSHKCIVVDENNKPKNEKYPECQDSEYTYKHLVSEIMPGQVATLMCRNIYNDPNYDTSIMRKGLVPGDRLNFFLLLNYGKIYCSDEVMSAYRHITSGGSSFSATRKYSFEKEEIWGRSLLDYAKSVANRKEVIKIAEFIYFRILMQALLLRVCSIGLLFKKMRENRLSFWIFFVFLRYKIRKDVLKKKFWL